jgi:hypothetical protein
MTTAKRLRGSANCSKSNEVVWNSRMRFSRKLQESPINLRYRVKLIGAGRREPDQLPPQGMSPDPTALSTPLPACMRYSPVSAVAHVGAPYR